MRKTNTTRILIIDAQLNHTTGTPLGASRDTVMVFPRHLHGYVFDSILLLIIVRQGNPDVLACNALNCAGAGLCTGSPFGGPAWRGLSCYCLLSGASHSTTCWSYSSLACSSLVAAIIDHLWHPALGRLWVCLHCNFMCIIYIYMCMYKYICVILIYITHIYIYIYIYILYILYITYYIYIYYLLYIILHKYYVSIYYIDIL